MDGDAGHLGHGFFHEAVERRAADDEAVALYDGELVYLHLQLLAGAAHQDAFLLQRPDEIQDAADVLYGGGPRPLGALAHYLGTEPLAAEQLLQHGAVILIAHQVGARHAAAAGGDGRAQVAGGAGHLLTRLLQLHQQLFGLLGKSSEMATPCLFITPWVLLKQMSLSAFRSTATRRATSSELRLKLSPVTEQPMGEMSTKPC